MLSDFDSSRQAARNVIVLASGWCAPSASDVRARSTDGRRIAIGYEIGQAGSIQELLNGRQRITKKTMHRRGNQVKFEGNFLAPTSVQSVADDFWNLQFAKYEPQGEELRHGKWQEWYSNGQLKMSGQYDHDKMVGQFTYWHSNGQKAAEGEYVEDKHDGTWVWWHQNGQKSVTGGFQDGNLIDQWRWWAENGKLTKQLVHDGTLPFESLAEESPNVDNKSARVKGRVQR